MIIEIEIPDTVEGRSAITGLRDAVAAVRRHYEPDATDNAAGAMQLGESRDGRRVTITLIIDADYPLAAITALWPWIGYLHGLSGLPDAPCAADMQTAAEWHPGRSPRQQARLPVSTPTASYLQWDAAESWNVGGVAVPLDEMESGWLAVTVNWCVRSRVDCWRDSSETDGTNAPPILAASEWLVQQPAFQGLVREAARRGMSFPADVAEFLYRYRLNVPAQTAYLDPVLLVQQAALRKALQQPTSLTPPVRDGYRRRVQAVPREVPTIAGEIIGGDQH